MRQQGKSGSASESAVEQEMRDQEVVRANKELAEYFKGRRTEREARAALKIIKAYVRDRERRETKSRPPMPGGDVAKTPKEATNRKAARDGGERHQRKRRRKHPAHSSKRVPPSIEGQVVPAPSEALDPDEPMPG